MTTICAGYGALETSLDDSDNEINHAVCEDRLTDLLGELARSLPAQAVQL